MNAQDLGWGAPGCTADHLVRVTVAGMLDSTPYFPLRVRREVAPLFTELVRWLVAERRRLGLPPVSSSGGYNKRLVRGSTTEWSNHSWALAIDLNAAANPMQSALRTDMPPGTSEKARSLGLVWGGDYSGRKDPMHFEFVGSPADADRLVTDLGRPAAALTVTTPAPTVQEDDVKAVLLKAPDAGAVYAFDGLRRWYVPTPAVRDELRKTGVYGDGVIHVVSRATLNAIPMVTP